MIRHRPVGTESPIRITPEPPLLGGEQDGVPLRMGDRHIGKTARPRRRPAGERRVNHEPGVVRRRNLPQNRRRQHRIYLNHLRSLPTAHHKEQHRPQQPPDEGRPPSDSPTNRINNAVHHLYATLRSPGVSPQFQRPSLPASSLIRREAVPSARPIHNPPPWA